MTNQFLNIPYIVLADKDFNLTDKAVYAYLLGWSKTSDKVFPAVATMAAVLGCGESAIKAATAKLTKAGKISKQRQFNKSNVYTVNAWDAPQEVHEQPAMVVSPEPEVVSEAHTEAPTAISDDDDDYFEPDPEPRVVVTRHSRSGSIGAFLDDFDYSPF